MFGVEAPARQAYEDAMGQADEAGAVERYLACLAVHDWDGLAATIADEDLIREGPFCDVVAGKLPYLCSTETVMQWGRDPIRRSGPRRRALP